MELSECCDAPPAGAIVDRDIALGFGFVVVATNTQNSMRKMMNKKIFMKKINKEG